MYTDKLVTYPAGNKAHIVVLHFGAALVGGELVLSDETTGFGYFTIGEIHQVELLGKHTQRIMDTLERHTQALIQ